MSYFFKIAQKVIYMARHFNHRLKYTACSSQDAFAYNERPSQLLTTKGERAGRKFSSTFRPAFSPDPTDCAWVSEDAVSTVCARNAWHDDALLCPKYGEKRAEKRVADYESRCLRKRD